MDIQIKLKEFHLKLIYSNAMLKHGQNHAKLRKKSKMHSRIYILRYTIYKSTLNFQQILVNLLLFKMYLINSSCSLIIVIEITIITLYTVDVMLISPDGIH